MFNLLSIVAFGDLAPADAVARLNDILAGEGARLPGVVSSYFGRTLPNALYGGDMIWRVAFESEQHYWACIASPQWQTSIAPALASVDGRFVDTVPYRPIRSHVAPDRANGGIWRCLVLSVDADTPRDTIRTFEQDMLLMPDHVATIGSWSFGRAVASRGRRRWTHVWEQEFASMAGLERDYMLSPVHWGFIDGWYDPESPSRIVDIICIVHAALARDGAVIL